MTDPSTDHAALFADERRLVWSLCYRMTGSAADADDLTQETFLRAIEQPPARTDMPWRPWLVRVAMNLARDAAAPAPPLRPAPAVAAVADRDRRRERAAGLRAAARVGQPDRGALRAARSVSFAFLLARSRRSPRSQRAVLLLRDVFDYSVRETADALGMNEPARSRRRITAPAARWRATTASAASRPLRGRPTPATRCGASLTALQADDVPALEALPPRACAASPRAASSPPRTTS